MNKYFSWLVLASLWAFVPGAQASSVAIDALNSADWNGAGNDFVVDNNDFRGSFQDGRMDWGGTFCDGSLSYQTVFFKGHMDKIDIQAQDDSSIIATADFSDLYFRVDDIRERSDYSFCIPLSVPWIGIGIDDAHIEGKGTFTEGGKEDLSDLNFRILATKSGTIHIGNHVPQWFEQRLTWVVNRVFERVWASKLGAWISDTIAAEVKKKIPHNGEGRSFKSPLVLDTSGQIVR